MSIRLIPTRYSTRSSFTSSLKTFTQSQVIIYRQFHDTPNTQNTATQQSFQNDPNHMIPTNVPKGVNLTTPTPASPLSVSAGLKHPGKKVAPNEFLKAFNNKELISFLMMGLCTLNSATLKLCIKLFPYVPMAVIKALVYRIYCGGETLDEVKQAGLRLHERGINNMMISLTIEACDGNDNVDPEYIIDETVKSINGILEPHTKKMIETCDKNINDIPSGYVALKPTGFVKNAANVLKNYNNGEEAAFAELVAKASRACEAVYEANQRLAKQYPDRTAPFVVAVIDAEKYELQPGVYELQRQLYKKFNKLNEPCYVVGTLQMYLSDSASLLAKEERLAQENNYRIGLKLVRGAYIHSEKDRATIIHKTKQDTDDNYNAGITYCIDSILNQKDKESTIGHLVVASHNADSLKLASTKVYTQENATNINKSNVVLGQLLGMADHITYDLIKNYQIGNVIKYVPWGPPLETKQYLLRRLEENGDTVRNDNGWPLVKATFNTLMGRLFNKTSA
ncbi:PUT1 [Candida metapsilosis]|uniref:Proline dehydrogenase n=1 Tax=Candida metapsilosis TaxID=273372 RepID=A0A8H8D929_9ASCO|nr:PUT1 [Candida metapsilosis]